MTFTVQSELDVTEFTTVAAAVPEPSAWALMLMGFGALGGALRSHRRHFAAI